MLHSPGPQLPGRAKRGEFGAIYYSLIMSTTAVPTGLWIPVDGKKPGRHPRSETFPETLAGNHSHLRLMFLMTHGCYKLSLWPLIHISFSVWGPTAFSLTPPIPSLLSFRPWNFREKTWVGPGTSKGGQCHLVPIASRLSSLIIWDSLRIIIELFSNNYQRIPDYLRRICHW